MELDIDIVPVNAYTVTAAILASYICYVVISRWRSKLPPGPIGYPFIGSMAVLSNGENVPHKLRKISQRYGDIFCLGFGILMPPVVIVMGYDLIKEVFVTKATASRGRNAAPDRRKCPGLVSSNGVRWKYLRQYAARGLKDVKRNPIIVGRIEEEAAVLVKELAKLAEQEVCEPYETLVNASTNAVIMVVAGIRYDYDDPELAEFKGDNRAYQKVTQIISLSSIMSLLRFLPGRSSGPRIRVAVLNRRREKLRNCVEKTKEILDDDVKSDLIRVGLDLIKQGTNEYMNEENMVEVLMDGYVAGVMPIANLVSFVLIFMMHYPDVQEKCHQELSALDTDCVKLADKERLSYVWAVICEVTRLAGTPLNIPHALEADIEVRGYHIPRGTILIGHISSAHTDPKYWSQPHVFDPDRWLDQDGKVRPMKAYLPFSLGPRMCIGQAHAEMATFLFIANVLHAFSISVPANHTAPPTTGLYAGIGGMKPVSLHVKITKRERHTE